MWQGFNNSGQGYPGDGRFRAPPMRPQYQNSPRYPPHRSPRSPYFTPPPNPSPGYPPPPHGFRHPGGSSPYQSTPERHRYQPRSSSHDMSPRFQNRGPQGRSPRFSPHSNFHSPRGDYNPGGSNDIQQYYHPSMLSDPWTNTPPVPVASQEYGKS